MASRKEEVITVKVDASLLEAMRGVPNRSRFVRDAILAALENTCPLCMGSGSLSPRQRQHWERFARSHSVRKCPDCHELHLTCGRATRQGKDRRPPAPSLPASAQGNGECSEGSSKSSATTPRSR